MAKSKSNERKGMRYPPLNDVIKRAHNKYELVIATAQRAREIVDGKDPLIPVSINNPISIATEEIYEDKISLVNPAFDLNNLPEDVLEESDAVVAFENDEIEKEMSEPAEEIEEPSEDLFI